MFSTIRSIFRSLLLVVVCLFHLIPLLIISVIKGFSLPRALKVRKRFCKIGLQVLNTKLILEGTPYDKKPAIYISNHRSYIDPMAALKDIKALPVAMAEIEKWPLIGFAAKSTGIMYVKREDKSSRKSTLAAMEKTIELGYSVLIYPEGTTTKEPTTLPFKKGAFRLAAELGVPVVPMAISYDNPDAIWHGPESFVNHFIQMFKKYKNRIKIRYGKPIYNKDAEALLTQTQEWINEQIIGLEQNWD